MQQIAVQQTHTYHAIIVGNDVASSLPIAEYLSNYEFEVSLYKQSAEVSKQILQICPDVVLLDAKGPDNVGLPVCKTIVRSFHGVVIIIGEPGNVFDEVVSLELGADYVTRPLYERALLARLRMHLSHRDQIDFDLPNQPIVVGALVIWPASRSVSMNGEAINLTTAEFDVLLLLAQNTGSVVRRSELHLKMTGEEYHKGDRTIDLRISRLRRKLGDDRVNPRVIRGIWGIGYLLSVPPGSAVHD